MAKTMCGLAVAALAASFCGSAGASERRFTYTYETGVLNPGDVEIEPWTTVRAGRERFYNRFDERIEFEAGVVERLQTAWYLNFEAVNQTLEDGTRESSFAFGGVSNEWKLKILDPVADPLGLGLYGEWSAGPTEAELEAKILLDRRLGRFLVALNLVGEHEWEFETAETEREVILEADAGLVYFLTPAVAAGVELRNHNEVVAGAWEHSAFFAGPVLSYSRAEWWTAATVLFQAAAASSSKGHGHGGGLALEEHERVNARLLFGLHL